MKALRIILSLCLILAVPAAGASAVIMKSGCAQHASADASHDHHAGHGVSENVQDCDGSDCRCLAQHCSGGTAPTLPPPPAHAGPAAAGGLAVATAAPRLAVGFPDRPLRPPISA